MNNNQRDTNRLLIRAELIIGITSSAISIKLVAPEKGILPIAGANLCNQ